MFHFLLPFFSFFFLVLSYLWFCFCSVFPLQFYLSFEMAFLPFAPLHALLLFRTEKSLVTELLCFGWVFFFFYQKGARDNLFNQRTFQSVTLPGFSKQTHTFRLCYKQFKLNSRSERLQLTELISPIIYPF